MKRIIITTRRITGTIITTTIMGTSRRTTTIIDKGRDAEKEGEGAPLAFDHSSA